MLAVMAPPVLLVAIGLVTTLAHQAGVVGAAPFADRPDRLAGFHNLWARTFHPLLAAQTVAMHLLALCGLAAGLPSVPRDGEGSTAGRKVHSVVLAGVVVAMLVAGVCLAQVAWAALVPLTAAGIGLVLARRAPKEASAARWVAVVGLVAVVAGLGTLDVSVESAIYAEHWGTWRSWDIHWRPFYGSWTPRRYDHLPDEHMLGLTAWLPWILPVLTLPAVVLGLRWRDLRAWKPAVLGVLGVGGLLGMMLVGVVVERPDTPELPKVEDVEALPIAWAGVDEQRVLRLELPGPDTVVVDGQERPLSRKVIMEALGPMRGSEGRAVVVQARGDVPMSSFEPTLWVHEGAVFLELPDRRWVRLHGTRWSSSSEACTAELPGVWPETDEFRCPWVEHVRVTDASITVGALSERLSRHDARHVHVVGLEVEVGPWSVFVLPEVER